jgi:hypothetical protein
MDLSGQLKVGMAHSRFNQTHIEWSKVPFFISRTLFLSLTLTHFHLGNWPLGIVNETLVTLEAG